MSSNHYDEAKTKIKQRPIVARAFKGLLRAVTAPLLFLFVGVALLGLLGLAQQQGWISAGNTTGITATKTDVNYICPMMCTAPSKVPGRCPVCAMELVLASSAGPTDARSIVVDPASRRVANIQTIAAKQVPDRRNIRAVGEIAYDESNLKTISAYSDGRFDKLYVDYTGAVVNFGDRLATFYSPELYSAQVEYIQATKSLQKQSSKALPAVAAANQNLQRTARQRMIELGMTESQIQQVEASGEAKSRLDVLAPMSGTVIQKTVVEGDYVKEGQAVFKLADLSTVWLMLELFPEDAATVQSGQSVDAQITSLPGQFFVGQIAFIDPDIDPTTRTVSVRIALQNEAGLLRIGEYANAQISVPISRPSQVETIATVVPRNAVLTAAGQSVVYVEEDPGRFVIRRVTVGAAFGSDIVIEQGLAEGEKVATKGNFLIDSQMQLAGNPSLIDPSQATSPIEMIAGFDAEMLTHIRMLPNEEQPYAIDQVICPITKMKLGSMGVPPKATVAGQAVYLCCEGCRKHLMKDPEGYLSLLQTRKEDGRLPKPKDEPKKPSDSALPAFDHIQPFTQEEENNHAAPIGRIRMRPLIGPDTPIDTPIPVGSKQAAETAKQTDRKDSSAGMEQ